MRHLIRLLALGCLVAAAIAASAGIASSADVRLHLDVRVDEVRADTVQRLRDAGFEITIGVPELGRWQGLLPAERLEALRNVPGVVAVTEPQYARFSAGAALTEGDEALNASLARARFNVDGSNVRVAVISDGIAGLDRAQSNGEAPLLAEARAFGRSVLGGGQEGTAMIEIVHDLAPGATISFGAVGTDLELIGAVNHFAKHVDIIVDDVSFEYPADQRSDVSVNTANALKHPDWPLRLYVTAAGNWAESHWSGEWRAGVDGRRLGLPASGAVQQFNGARGGSVLYGGGNAFRVEPGDHVRLALFWDDVWDRSTNDYDLYLLSGIGEVLASSRTRQGVGVHSHIPRERIEYTHVGAATDLFAVIQNPNDDARPVKFHLFALRPGGGDSYRLHHRTVVGSLLAQSDAEGALTVGAVNVGDQMIAAYSSYGPTLNGVPKPEILAVDAVTVSDTTGFAPRFAGSSAAAPHVAGVAALLLDAQPSLLAADGGDAMLERRLIRDLLITTARDIPPADPEDASGAGLVDAEAALLAAIQNLTVVRSTADGGPGSLRGALTSGASIILFDSTLDQRTITLASRLPPISSGTIVDGSGWTIDASAIDIGVALESGAELWGLRITGAADAGALLSGDGASLQQVQLDGNRTGIRITGIEAELVGTWVRRNEWNGIQIDDGGSATVSRSTIESNGNAGVFASAGAIGAHIGPPGQPPELPSMYSLWPPIDPLASPAPEPRAGQSLTVAGTVSMDGVPAESGSMVTLYLDRRLAASVPVDGQSRFFATVTGPGTEIRFAVNGIPVEQRLAFETSGIGNEASLTLRAVSPGVSVGADMDGAHTDLGNVIRDNRIGVAIEASGDSQPEGRIVWGNEMRRNRTNIMSPLAAPTIEAVSWEPTGVAITGKAGGSGAAHLYAGPAAERRFAASAAVINGQFSFRHLSVDGAASHFSVIAHSTNGLASAESDVHRAGGRGRITSVTPDRGYVGGGDSVMVCGSTIATDSVAPKVWFGNQPARISFWSGECITVVTPPAAVGLVDVQLQLVDARPVVKVDAFEYRAERIVKLRRGWNMVTWAGEATRSKRAFVALLGLNFRAYAWSAEEQQWRIYATELPSGLNTLRTLTRDQPLMIFLDGPDIDWPQPAAE